MNSGWFEFTKDIPYLTITDKLLDVYYDYGMGHAGAAVSLHGFAINW